MKKYRLICMALVALLALAALVGCTPTREDDGEYIAYTFSDVVMTQLGINTYRFDFDVDSGSEQVKVYFTERDRLKDIDVAEEVTSSVSGNKAHFSFIKQLQLSEEYYLWVVGDKQAELPITAPSMFPNIEQTEGGVMFHFNYSYNVSWSSFCDPTGRAVYVSDKSFFDDTATVLREGIKITEQDYIIPEEQYSNQKYYYSVTTAKNGLLKIISAPISTSDTVMSEIKDVKLSLVTKDNVPTMTVELAFAENSKVDLNVANDLQLFVKNDIGDEIYSSPAVWADNKATFTFDCSQLITAGKWYDVCLAYRGSMIGDVPCSVDNVAVDTSGSCANQSGLTYRFANYEGQLKVYYEYPPVTAFDMCNFTVEFDADNEAIVLTIIKLFDGNSIPTLAITDGSTDKVLETTYRIDGNKYVYTLNVHSLSKQDNWYDIRLFFDSVCAEISKDAAVQFGQEFKVGDRVYSFQEYNGLLKIQFTSKS